MNVNDTTSYSAICDIITEKVTLELRLREQQTRRSMRKDVPGRRKSKVKCLKRTVHGLLGKPYQE